MSKQLVISLIIISFVLGLGTGFVLSPEYATRMASKQSPMQELGNADKYLDQRYLDNMIAHHQSAIYLAKQAKEKSKREEIKNLANAIIETDEASILQLYSWKKDWYKNTKKITNFDKLNLGDGDDRFDLRLLNALVVHHDEAINIAKEIQTKSSRNEILNLADDVIQGLGQSKTQLLEWRKNWYQI